MPYGEKKVKGGYSVRNKKTGRVLAKKTSKANADAQMRLLQGIEHNPKFAKKVRARARRKSDNGVMYT